MDEFHVEMTDRDLLIAMRTDIGHIKQALAEASQGGYPRCAKNAEAIVGIQGRLKWIYGLLGALVIEAGRRMIASHGN